MTNMQQQEADYQWFLENYQQLYEKFIRPSGANIFSDAFTLLAFPRASGLLQFFRG